MLQIVSNLIPFRSVRHQLRLSLVVLSLALAVLSFIEVEPVLRANAQRQVQPILRFNAHLGYKLLQPLLQARKLAHYARRLQDLERKLAIAQAQLGELEQLKQENQELRGLLENSDRKLTATYITQPILSFARAAVAIDPQLTNPAPGKQLFQIQPGQAVLVSQTLVGRISQVATNLAYVDLLWQQDVDPVLARTEQGVEGLVQGDGKRVLLTQVPVQSSLQVGDRVLTMGQPGIPGQIFVGQVQSIESGPAEATKQAVLEQYVSFYEAAVVEIR
jgi:cell shape-determining protein MreC